MKRSYQLNILACTVILLSLCSCEKFLTHDNPTSVSDDNWWYTEANATSALDAVYVGIPDGVSGRQVMYLSALSDELVARQSSRGNYEAFVKGVHGTNWDVGAGIWEDDYKDIRRACRFLENVDRCYMDSALKSRYKYEARALRAYYHMELLLFFGGIPVVTESVTPSESYLSRDSEQEVFDFVVSELNICADHLPKSYNTAEMKRFTSGICLALITRVALFYQKYDVVRDAAKRIIESGQFALYNNYANLFKYTGELNNERIFFRVNSSGGGSWNTIAPQGSGGKTTLSPTANIVNSYETRQGKTIMELGPDSFAIYQQDPNYNNNRDPRLNASVLLPGESFTGLTMDPFNPATNNLDAVGAQYSTATGYWVEKYLDPKDKSASSSNRTLDFMIIRYAEILLSYVEALIELDDWQNPDVLKYLDQVRNRAGMPDVDVSVYNSKEKLRELVRRERMVELAFEGVRYFDIRRWGIMGDVMNGQVYGATNPATGEPVTVEVRSANVARDFWWPIPQGEMLANPNMTQNPNY